MYLLLDQSLLFELLKFWNWLSHDNMPSISDEYFSLTSAACQAFGKKLQQTWREVDEIEIREKLSRPRHKREKDRLDLASILYFQATYDGCCYSCSRLSSHLANQIDVVSIACLCNDN